jgi:hypothetical protein
MSRLRQRLTALLKELDGLDGALTNGGLAENLSPESVRDALHGIRKITDTCATLEAALLEANMIDPGGDPAAMEEPAAHGERAPFDDIGSV